MNQPEALFIPDGELLVPTELARGPWDLGALHGGPMSGLAGWAVERAAPTGLQLTRLTVELWSAVGLEPLSVAATVAKPGRRMAIVDAEARQGGRVVMRATSMWGAANGGPPVAAMPAELPVRPSEPFDPSAGAFDYPRPGFNCDAVELRPVSGNTEDPGPGVIWLRVRQPVVAGSELTPLQAVSCASDLGAAVGWEPSTTGQAMINPDITLQLTRHPTGPWLLFASQIHLTPAGLGFMETTVSDDEGPFGRILQTQLESPYQLRRD